MKQWLKVISALFFLLCFANSSFAQGSLIKDIAWRYTTSGAFPAPGATITVCTSTATGAPCSPKVSLFSDAALTIPVNNPLSVCSSSPQTGCIDGLGNWSAYVSPGGYTYSASGAGLTAYGPVPIYASVINGGPATLTNLNNTLYVSQFAGADLGAKANAAAANCTTLGFTACNYVLDTGGIMSTSPNFPLGSFLTCTATAPITVATTWTQMHRGVILEGNGCQLNYNQDSGSAAVSMGKNASGTVNTSGASVTCVTGCANFNQIDVGDQIYISGSSAVVYNVCPPAPTAGVLTTCASVGSLVGSTYKAMENATQGIGNYGPPAFRDWVINYTGAGTTSSQGLSADWVQKPIITNVLIQNFTGNQSLGLKFTGVLTAQVSSLQLVNNKCQALLDQSTGAGQTVSSNVDDFRGLVMKAGGACATNIAFNVANGFNDTVEDSDIEGNVTRYALYSQGSSFGFKVKHNDFEKNGDGTVNSYDLAFNSGFGNIAEQNNHTSLVANTPNGGVLCNNSGTVCDISNESFPTPTFYTIAYNYISGATGRTQNNQVGALSATDPVSAESTAGNYSANTYKSIVPTGTAPLSIASTTLVPNLNTQVLNGVTVTGVPTAGQVLTYTSPTAASPASPAGLFTSVNVTPATASANTAADQNGMAITVTAAALNSLSRTLLIQLAGVYSTPAASTSIITDKLKLCTVSGCGSGTVVTLATWTTTALGGIQATNDPYNLILNATTQTAGASAALEAHGNLTIDLGALATAAESVFADGNTATVGTIDSTAQLFLQHTKAFSNASASNSFTDRQMIADTVD